MPKAKPKRSEGATATRQKPRPFDRELNDRHTAYHEAAHAVIAYHLGWWLNDEGVRIGEWPYTGHRCAEDDYTDRSRIAVAIAGLLAEMRLPTARIRRLSDESLQEEIDSLRWDWDPDDNSDGAEVFRLLNGRTSRGVRCRAHCALSRARQAHEKDDLSRVAGH